MTTVQIGSMIFPERTDWGWFFNDIIGWDDTSEDKSETVEKPRGRGAFASSEAHRSALPLTLMVGFAGSERVDLLAARMQLSALGATGPVEMKVTDELGTFTREVKIRHKALPSTRGRIRQDQLAIDMLAHDPLKYGLPQFASTELPTPGTGLVWPITYPIDWGTPGSGGELTLTNLGSAAAAPVFRVSGGLANVTITEAGTGRRLILDRVIPEGSVVEFDGRSRRVVLDGTTDISATFLTKREWMTIDPFETARFLFSGTPTGGVPTLTGELQSAWW